MAGGIRFRYDLIAEAILTQKFFRIDQIHKKLKYYRHYV